jgi:uncharacterized damage-inducible protein DinB
MKASRATAILAMALLSAPALLSAQENKSAPPTPVLTAPQAGGIRAELIRQMEDAEKKLLALAEATPADKFAWRPAQGVRTTGEVFLHVAGGNYFLPTFWGVKPPEGLDLRGIEKDAADKTKVIAAMKKSFDHARQAILSAPEAEMERNVKLFGRDATMREAFLMIPIHAHEHLGQSIAYARMSGITPPWSQGGGE